MADAMATVPGFRGRVCDVEVLSGEAPDLPAGPDLVEMARRSLSYLRRNPDAAHNWDARFTLLPHRCPPFAPQVTAGLFEDEARRRYEGIPHIDPVAIGDTESRNDIAANLMAEIAGAACLGESLEAVHRRLAGYVRSLPGRRGDGLCWCLPCSLFAAEADGPYAMVWTTAMLLHSEADRYRLTGDGRHRDLARRLFDGLQRVARWDGERAWFPHGVAPFRDGETTSGAYPGHYPNVIAPLLEYARSCNDGDAVAFARAMAEGFLADLQPGHQHKRDGHVHGHSHLQMHAIRGVAQLGALTGDSRLLDWSTRAYEYNHRASFDTGWLPEQHWHPLHRGHSETCLVADMLETEAWLARAGRPHLWDRVERAVRNYLAPAQFAVTDSFEAFWRDVNGHLCEEELQRGLAGLSDLEGGFLGGMAPNDWVIETSGEPHHGMTSHRGRHLMVEMPGCCPPSAMRALHCAWSHAVTATDEGVWVNLALDRDAPQARVTSHLPRRSCLEVEARTAGDVLIRPPEWAPRDRVELRRNGSGHSVRWGGPEGAYVVCDRASPGDRLELEWPLVRFRQTLAQQFAVNSEEEEARFEVGPAYTFSWTGSTVTDVEPGGVWLPWCPCP